MNLLQTSILSLLSTAVKMLAAVAISKTLAVVGGPAGLALVGQFQNFVQIMLTIAKGALDTGVTKYTAEYGSNKVRRSRLFSTALRLSLFTSVLISLILLFAAKQLSAYLLHSLDYAYVFRIFSLTVVLFVLNSLLLAILNGLQEIKLYILINIAQNLITLVMTIGLISWLGVDGALIALVTNQSIILGILLFKLRAHKVIKFDSFRLPIDRTEAVRLGKYGMMAAVSAVVAPMTSIVIRDHIASVLSIELAGYWQAMWYISTIYMTIVTTSLAVYYLPKLAATSDPKILQLELIAGYKLIMPIVIFLAVILYLMKELVVSVLFTEAFSPMLVLFRWMLIGDVIKLASWLLAYLMLAKAMTLAFIVTEIVFSISFFVLVLVFVNGYGFEGLSYAYSCNYALYLISVALITRGYWHVK